MVGNDVVDLADPQCLPRGTHPRFDQRVFAPSELHMMHASATPARLRWMLWAAKESAYKVLRKRDPAVAFAPRRFVVEPHDSGAGRMSVHGTVTCAGNRVAFRGVIDGEALHVVAADAAPRSFEVVAAVVEAATDEPGVAVRRVAAAALADRLGVPANDLRIVRQDRIPRLQLRGAPLTIDLSLSHHGRFVGFAALVPCYGGGM
ncbi:MAG: hypothetical protein H6Q33_1333 [Deltaproteobacteria bacterium]|nr:hypothetical protein [Deltaproteobacteria bacterium]